MHLNFSPLLLADGFTKWSSLLLRVSWRRWGSVSWQLPPRNIDREHLKGMKHQGVDSVCIITRMVQDKRQNWFRA